jgi:predicted carbohydrate-binding protein with CBM48
MSDFDAAGETRERDEAREHARLLRRAVDELRAPVPVRGTWRSGLLEAIDRETPPTESERELTGAPMAAPAPRARRVPGRGVFALAIAAALAVAAVGGAALARGIVPGLTSDRTPAMAATPAGPRAPVTAVGRQSVRFAFQAPHATQVAIVGDFNGWNPAAMPLRRDAAGTWNATIPLPPGRHLYAFVVDGTVVPDPAAPRTTEEDFGVANSVVFVAPVRGAL